ncbi:MAG: penicillin-binding protein, partial [Prevotella sp.]|nr:penicillin-binding protein [Prevotella sp.]
MTRKFVRFLWGILLGLILITAGGAVAIWNGWIGYMPNMDDLQNPISRYSSQVFSAEGKMMGTYASSRDNRISTPFSGISPNVVHALVATEDERFYEHSGVDFKALSRAILKRGILGNESAGGGSTITQQLAKQLYSKVAHSKLERLFQKPIEWVIAVKLERTFTKEEIITMYLNYFDFLYNAIGIKSAAKTYFNKDPKDLSVVEAATLVGLCKNPSFYNPMRYPERCVERRNIIISQMHNGGFITDNEYRDALAEPLQLDFQKSGDREAALGIAPYFREFLRQYMSAVKPDKKDY